MRDASVISVSPLGELVTLCRGGQLILIADDARNYVETTDDALAVAFDREAWLVEDGHGRSRIRRVSAGGEVLEEIDLGDAGAPIYVHPMLAPMVGLVAGLERRTVIASVAAGEFTLKEVQRPADRIFPARSLVYINDGAAFTNQNGAQTRLSELKVSDGWPLLNGSNMALLGRDSRGSVVEVISTRPGGHRARLRADADVIIGASQQKSLVVFISGRTLTVYDVLQARRTSKRKLSLAAIDLAVSANGEVAVVVDEKGMVEWISLADMTLPSSVTFPASTEAEGGLDLSQLAADEEEGGGGDGASSRTNKLVWGTLIDGHFLEGEPAGALESRSPADPNNVLGAICYGHADVDLAVAAARAASSKWSNSRLRTRIAGLQRFEAELSARRDQLVSTMSQETGRPLWECRREVRGLSQRLLFTLGRAPTVLDPEVDDVASTSLHKLPWGVVAVIGPAMFPLATSHQHIVAGLVAGNTVVWKPSPLCPTTSRLYAEALRGADLPPGVANVVVGPDRVGAELAAHSGVDCVVFSGSRPNGADLREDLASADKKLILHLGAKNPALVAKDCLIELAAHEIATSAFLTAGQRCTAISRVFVESSIADKLVAALVSVCKRMRIGVTEGESFYGPILTEERLGRFLARLDAALDQGASPALRGERLERPGNFVTPSIHLVENVQLSSPYQKLEHFGPDLAVYPVDSIDDAIELCNGVTDDLCASLFSESHTIWSRFLSRGRFGTLMHNLGTHSISGRAPFGSAMTSAAGERAGGGALQAMCRDVSAQERRDYVIDIYPGMSPPVTTDGTNSDG